MDIMQTMNNMEQLRKKCVISKVAGIALTVFGTFLLCTMRFNYEIIFFIMALILMLTGVAVMKLFDKEKMQFQFLYKNTFAKGVLDSIFSDVVCNWEIGFHPQQIEGIGLIRMGNRIHSEDYVSGTYQGVKFEQADVVVKHVVRSGKSTHTYTYFEGRVFSFDFPKTDYWSVAVFSKSFTYSGALQNLRHDKVEMESKEFNRNFIVRAMRPVDAFYVLKPQVMECISNLYSHYGNVAIRYVGGKMYVAINLAGNAFDGDIYKKIIYAEEVDKIRRDCSVIIDVIKSLNV